MHLVYIDDSRDESICAFSALVIPADQWRTSFEIVRTFRRDIRNSDGIFVYKELHATEFVAGRGRVAPNVVFKGRRCEIFKETLKMMSCLPDAHLFNAVFSKNQDAIAFERLLNRINRTMKAWNSKAIIFCDEGKDKEYTRLARKMQVNNPIPSQFGGWPSGLPTKNIPLEYILEDPVFKDSKQSYFIQLADFAAYALLRKERPLPSKTKYGLDKAFYLMNNKDFFVTAATGSDPEKLGIIR